MVASPRPRLRGLVVLSSTCELACTLNCRQVGEGDRTVAVYFLSFDVAMHQLCVVHGHAPQLPHVQDGCSDLVVYLSC